MAANGNAEFGVDNSLNRTDLLVQTDMNQSESSNSRNLRLSSDRSDQVQKMSDDSAVAKEKGSLSHGVAHQHHHDDEKEEMRDLEELMSKLNPLAPEFSIGSSHRQGKANNQTIMEQKKDAIKRTVFLPNLDSKVTEQQLADLFNDCGQIVEIRVCGDPRSILRLAFIEFTYEEGARKAFSLAGTMLRCRPIKVLPSKTAIAPLNPTFLPKSEDERERCARTVYCTNIDTKVTRKDVKNFFESYCGEVLSMRLLGDVGHATRIAFVEFTTAESAIAALNCSGVIMGSLQIRISPSKTPVKSRRFARAGSRTNLDQEGRSSE